MACGYIIKNYEYGLIKALHIFLQYLSFLWSLKRLCMYNKQYRALALLAITSNICSIFLWKWGLVESEKEKVKESNLFVIEITSICFEAKTKKFM